LSSASATALSHTPAFTIHPGEDGRRAVLRLLDLVPDVLRVEGESASLFEPQSGEPPVEAYGTDHALLQARYSFRPGTIDWVQVFGQGVVAEAFDWQEIEDRGGRLRQVHDANLTSASAAQARAATALRRAALATAVAELVVPAHCGQELYDVVSVRDERVGLVDAPYRVLGLDLHYTRRGRRPRYEHRLLLGVV
jgi:hypothetical protein